MITCIQEYIESYKLSVGFDTLLMHVNNDLRIVYVRVNLRRNGRGTGSPLKNRGVEKLFVPKVDNQMVISSWFTFWSKTC